MSISTRSKVIVPIQGYHINYTQTIGKVLHAESFILLDSLWKVFSEKAFRRLRTLGPHAVYASYHTPRGLQLLHTMCVQVKCFSCEGVSPIAIHIPILLMASLQRGLKW